MTPTALANALENNSRQAEQQLREVEQALYVESDQETQHEHLIASKLTEIAGLQLEFDPAQDQQTRLLLDQRKHAWTDLGQELEKVERLIASSLEQHRQVRKTIDALGIHARQQLEQDPTFLQLLEQLDAAHLAEQQAEAGYEEIRNECASKLQDYAANPVYGFLKGRQYGTEQYRPWPFMRTLDDYLARKVNFRVNHANEQILLAMQARNETQGQTLGDARIHLQIQHQQRLDSIRDTLGAQALMAEEQKLNALLSETKARANALHEQQAAFTEQRDPRMLQIRQGIANRLNARPLSELILEAAQTPDSRDDVLVSDLQLLHARLREVQQRLKAVRDDAADKRRLYDRAKFLQSALRTDQYQDEKHEYELPRPIDQVLADYMSGLLDLQSVQKLLDEARQYIPPHRRGNAGEHHWRPRSDRAPGGSSSSASGGFRTTGSSGGGGFRTTDSF